MKYLYESSLSGLYLTDEKLDFNALFDINDLCRYICGDYDDLLLEINDEYELAEELRKHLDVFNLGGYCLEDLQEIYNEYLAMENK